MFYTLEVKSYIYIHCNYVSCLRLRPFDTFQLAVTKKSNIHFVKYVGTTAYVININRIPECFRQTKHFKLNGCIRILQYEENENGYEGVQNRGNLNTSLRQYKN